MVSRKQFEAADMDASQHSDRLPGVDPGSKQHRKIQSEIDLVLRNRGRDIVRGRIHIADFGEAFGAQQLLGDLKRRLADRKILGDADGSRVEFPLRGQRSRQAEQARPDGQRKCGQKASPCLPDFHRTLPVAGAHATLLSRELMVFLQLASDASLVRPIAAEFGGGDTYTPSNRRT